VNMARRPRTQYKQFKGLPLWYERSFGSKKSFERGFALGLEAGYGDGYAGKTFRAVDSLRMVGGSLNAHPGRGDPGNIFFDRGVTLGYQDWIASSQSARNGTIVADMNPVKCSFHPDSKKQAEAEPSYCDGYRRGFLLGKSDGLDLSPEQMLLEASK